MGGPMGGPPMGGPFGGQMGGHMGGPMHMGGGDHYGQGMDEGRNNLVVLISNLPDEVSFFSSVASKLINIRRIRTSSQSY